MRKTISRTIFFIGFMTILGQIILMRELIVIFYGNELTIGITLGIWLLATSLGSGLLGRIIEKLEDPLRTLAIALFTYALLFIVTLLFVRYTPALFGRSYGEITGIVSIIITSFITILPLGLTGGALFPLGYRCYSLLNMDQSVSVGNAYLHESIGAAAGGLVGTLVLLRFCPPFVIAGLLLSITCITIYLVLAQRKMILVTKIRIIFVAILINLLFYLNVSLLETKSRQFHWQNAELIHSENSIYGNISIIQQNNTTSLFENGLLMFTYPDWLTTEESIHFTMLQHPTPERVLLIGGGINGSLQEVLKYPSVRQIDYVELDPKIMHLAKKFMPDSIMKILHDPRVFTHHVDGKIFIRQTRTRYDVILVNLPDPYNAMINRFYTEEFFHEAAQKLEEDDGVIGFGVTSSENFISSEQAAFLACLKKTVLKSFSDLVIIPGDMNYFVACKSKNQLTLDVTILIDRITRLDLKTSFIREYYLPYRLSPARVDYLNDQINLAGLSRTNRDFAPIGYYYNMVLWSTRFSQNYRIFFTAITQYQFKPIIILVVLITAGFLLWTGARKADDLRFHSIIRLSIAVVGFSEISLEFIIILTFQVIWGFAYHELGLIIASYMTGLAVGSFQGNKFIKRQQGLFARFTIFQLIMMLFLLILPAIIPVTRSAISAEFLLFVRFIFYLVAFFAGYIGGYQFPLASALLIARTANKDQVGSSLYAVDLFGSCLGALLLSAILLPILGIMQICLGLALLNGAVFLILWANHQLY